MYYFIVITATMLSPGNMYATENVRKEAEESQERRRVSAGEKLSKQIFLN
jgi:hypothetical protein